MKIRGAVHAHTNLSHDGTLTTRELIDWYRAHGFQFLAITEHSQDMTAEKVDRLRAECREFSDAGFLALPGMEYTCRDTIHVPGIGCTELISSDDPVFVAQEIRKAGCMAVLAHPRRIGWRCDPDLLRAVEAVEIWNVAYDGKLTPTTDGLINFPDMKKHNPSLLAIAAHDLHRTVSFYNVGLVMEIPELTSGEIIAALKSGRYHISSRWFSSGSSGELGALPAIRARLLSAQVGVVRQMRNQFRRWLQ